ncbi:hypothetical protein [Candidatus Frankia alpina]|uniref:Uncharacterized protein n=1 Tax=Candidatus Frankia alpina TaxID=2699483 RepID=A0A4S5EQV1_9ACTN|nr:hypothetical protein [Candidatus Frankia alpina]THJ74764.1 hypothetical protein E7Y31_09450 [Candidatus Frankia alpina]
MLYSAYEMMIWLDREKFIHLIMRMQAAGGNSDERCIVKTRAAKALAAAVVVGGSLFATGGTSFAANGYVGNTGGGGEPTAGFGGGRTAVAAERAALAGAAGMCERKAAEGVFADWQYADGSWWSVFNGDCAEYAHGTRLATGGTSFAASGHVGDPGRPGEGVVGFGWGKDWGKDTVSAETAARRQAARYCQPISVAGVFADWPHADGSWSSIFNGECSRGG